MVKTSGKGPLPATSSDLMIRRTQCEHDSRGGDDAVIKALSLGDPFSDCFPFFLSKRQ